MAGLKCKTYAQMVTAQNHTRDTKNLSPSKYHQVTSTFVVVVVVVVVVAADAAVVIFERTQYLSSA
jgi:hypothetical protein